MWPSWASALCPRPGSRTAGAQASSALGSVGVPERSPSGGRAWTPSRSPAQSATLVRPQITGWAREPGHPQRRVPPQQERQRKRHLEQILVTETWPGSKIISANPNGLSLAAHQTAVCVGNVWRRFTARPRSQRCVQISRTSGFPESGSFSGSEAVFKEGKGFTNC